MTLRLLPCGASEGGQAAKLWHLLCCGHLLSLGQLLSPCRAWEQGVLLLRQRCSV